MNKAKKHGSNKLQIISFYFEKHINFKIDYIMVQYTLQILGKVRLVLLYSNDRYCDIIYKRRDCAIMRVVKYCTLRIE